jgi:hypothetical protein
MTERLLQFIWQFQYFNKVALTTVENEPLHIIHAGTYNSNQGPDFTDAKIRIGNTTWAGSIELHIRTSHWNQHRHSADKNYNNVILHVVWEQDVTLQLPFQTLVLQNRVAKLLLQKYEALLHSGHFIACEKSIGSINRLVWMAWKERLLVERLEQKTATVFEYLQQNNNHWEESFWWMLAKNFGAKVNSPAFEKIAQSIPLTLLSKHKNQLLQLEALLFGQAGLLDKKFTEAYPLLLQREYNLQKTKYRLQQPEAPLYFLRMRPANFPSVRLAQLAMLVHKSLHLFAKIKESNTISEIKALLNITASDYWHTHYIPGEPAVFKTKHIGGQMKENILVNTVCVMLFAYGHYHNESSYKAKALQWLEAIAAEKNSITNGFCKTGISVNSAFDSQALIQLKQQYCDKKKCLDCAIGNKLLTQ